MKFNKTYNIKMHVVLGLALVCLSACTEEPQAGALKQNQNSEAFSDDDVINKALTFYQSTLNDPDSVKFRKVVKLPLTNQKDQKVFMHIICGEANSKNQYGGYDGFKPFLVEQRIDGDTTVYHPDTFAGKSVYEMYNFNTENGLCPYKEYTQIDH